MITDKFTWTDSSGSHTLDDSTIISCEFIDQVCTTDDISFGSAISASIILSVRGQASSAPALGTVLTYYRVENGGTETQVGVFNVTNTKNTTKNTYSLEAYDNMKLMDFDISSWLYDQYSDETYWENLTLYNLFSDVIDQAGKDIDYPLTIPHGDLQISKFYSSGLTGRSLLGIIAEVCGCYARCNPSGAIIMDWYSTNSYSITPSTDATTNKLMYYSGELNFESYQTGVIDRVQIHGSSTDIGVFYPTDATGATYEILNNIILQNLATDTADADKLALAQAHYEKLTTGDTVEYTPCSVRVPRNNIFRAGDIVNVTDYNGTTFKTILMQVTLNESGMSIISTGSESLSSTTAFVNHTYENGSGKMLELEADINGLNVKASDLESQVGQVKVQADKIELLVTDDSTTSSITITDELIQAIANQILLSGTVDIKSQQSEGTYVEIRDGYIYFYRGGSPVGRINSDASGAISIETTGDIEFVSESTGTVDFNGMSVTGLTGITAVFG